MSKRDFDEIGDEKLRYYAQQQEIDEYLEEESRLRGKSVLELLKELQEDAREMRESSEKVLGFRL